MTARGKIQRIAASDISVIGRNTQGVRIMSLDEDDKLAAVVRVPKDEEGEENAELMSDGLRPAGGPAPQGETASDVDAGDGPTETTE